ncbi:MAG TPA: endo-1,4-beta-xylanase [Chitinophagaceae bacterium]|nr:endo-1,4-beta-xylanase [Chitinophagaceae bacterium]
MKNSVIYFLVFLLAAELSSCSKKDPATPPVTPPVVPASTLKDAAGYPIGVGVSYDLLKNNSNYSGLVKTQFDRITAEYQMKHGANVKNDGSYDFVRTDEFVNTIAAANGVTVFGHTLVWHQNNNGNYLRSLAGTSGPNLVLNSGFENGFTNWFTQVSTTPPTAGSITLETADTHSGTQAAKVIVTTPGPNAYSIQIVSDNFSVANGGSYKLLFWAKSAANGQSLRAVAQGTSYYTAQDQSLTTTWTQYEFNFSPNENGVSIKFHFPTVGTFLIDDLSVKVVTGSLDPVLVKSALKDWVTTITARYKGKLTGWDVVNEVVVDGTGALRSGANSPGGGGDAFYWADYLGRSYIDSAFRWANIADPDAKLFINDYNLESDNRKLDSIIKIINELKTAGIPIHGVGVQMHISINTNNAGIDNVFQKLAATGLLIHVSEMDVRMNPSSTTGFTATAVLHEQQAQKYKYVAQSYFQNVPAAQRFAITVWNLTDADSWIVLSGKEDFPALFNSSYQKKAAFTGFLQGLK